MKQENSKVLESIMILTNYERKKFELDYIGTEHLLLAIANDETSTAKKLLESLNLSYNDIRNKVIELHKRDLELEKTNINSPILYRQYTEDCKEVLTNEDFFNAIDTLDMLGILLSVKESRAKEVLTELGTDIENLIKIVGENKCKKQT